ncbi:MAG: HDOD domain-containing protein [Pseudomonadota bacterium]|nr:MAG: HDOD domain-containing protein [Pseudomonadota bacterium]
MTARELILKNAQLVGLPEITLQLNALINNPRSNAAEISKLISRDPALTARLLRVVNSPFFGFPSQVESVSMAVTILGTRQLRDLVFSMSVMDRFAKVKVKGISLEMFWRHSLCCALACRALAARLQASNRERFFLGGLLHDIGKLVMYLAEPAKSAEVAELAGQGERTPMAIEHDVFGFDHAMVGEELLRYWRLPESLVEPVAQHHSPRRAQQYLQEAAVVHLGNGIANSLQPSLPGESTMGFDPRLWELIGMEADVMEAVMPEVSEQLEDSMQLLYVQQAAA